MNWECEICRTVRDTKEIEAFVKKLGYPVIPQAVMQLNCEKCKAIKTHWKIETHEKEKNQARG